MTAETSVEEGEAPRTAPSLDRGALVGRYVVIAELGAGAMGVVYSAYDPELDRRVALKVLRTPADQRDNRWRWLREAQALAKLRHPNVVTIHDVGEHHEHVWLAMEYVDGVTLSEWLRAQERRWTDVIRVLASAGRGLAAAHTVGLVHRDVKPSNIMVEADGRTLVTDFGLARAEHTGVEGGEPGSWSSGDALGVELTRPGTLVGTPAYMAPEQFRDERIDAKTDQFCFAVTCWEALHGVRPFSGNSVAELAAAVTAGRLEPPPATATVPPALRRVLERALQPDPDDRFLDMAALLEALEIDPGRRRRVALLVAVPVGLAVVLAGAFAWDRSRTEQGCRDDGDEIDATLGADALAKASAAVLASERAYAEDTWARVEARMTDYGNAWREERQRVCREAELHDEWDPRTYEQALSCFDERRDRLAAVLDVLATADSTVVQRAVYLVESMPPPTDCADVLALQRWPPLSGDAQVRREVWALRAELERAAALHEAGKHADARIVADAVQEQAAALGWPPLVAEANIRIGMAALQTGDVARSEAALVAAYEEAERAAYTRAAAEAATRLVYTVGVGAARPAEGAVWGHAALGAVARLGEEDGIAGMRLWNNLGALRQSQRELDLGLELFERAQAIAQRELPPTHPDLARLANNLGIVEVQSGNYAAAVAHLERALELKRTSLGERHPEVARTMQNLASVITQKDRDRAAALLSEALAIAEEGLGADHVELAAYLNNLGSIRIDQQRFEEAVPLLERAVALRREHLSPDHRDIRVALFNLARAEHGVGNHAAAAARLQDVLAHYERTGESDGGRASTERLLAEVRTAMTAR